MASLNITDLAGAADFVAFPPGAGQRFLLTVDTEEEFDWSRPLNRTGHSTDTVTRLRKFQEFCEGQGVVPIYLMDYPVAISPLAAELLRAPLAAGRAEVGVQLHPWVNPPFEEEVNQFNSFSGNLPIELERAKLHKLHATITENFGVAPRIYRAGRYGVGPNTAQILREVGICIDTSVRSHFDYALHGGPNFRDLPVRPWHIGDAGDLVEIPLTTVFTGGLRAIGPWLYPRLWRVARLRGVLSRLRLLCRAPLTPEGTPIKEALRAIDHAVGDGLPVLVFSFHSPSLVPGHTPYVQSEDDLDALYDWWRAAFARVRALGVAPSSVADMMQLLALARARPTS